MDLETRFAWPVQLELRRSGRELFGSFRYGSTATMSDRGRVRKESFGPRAFEYAVEDPQHEVTLLLGHDFNNPLATKRAGSLRLEDSAAALTFAASLPDGADQTIAQVDAVKQVRQGLVQGVSPGFRVPPRDVVPNAEHLEDEPGNPDVQVRVINAAVLYEISLVARPAYEDTEIDVRAFSRPGREAVSLPARRRIWL